MKALIITGKLATWEEYTYSHHRLLEAEAQLDIATRGKETVYGELKGPSGLVQAGPIVPTMNIPPAGHSNSWDLLVLPGGAKAMEYLRQDRDVLDFIEMFHVKGGVIASICHAAQLLISAKLVKGRRISGYYSIKDDIENAGGTFVDGVCVDDRIISAPHYRLNGPWMKAALQAVPKNSGGGEHHASSY